MTALINQDRMYSSKLAFDEPHLQQLRSRQCHWVAYVNYGEESYSRDFGLVHDLHAVITPKILKAIGNVTKSDDGPFVICDFGCADGGASLPCIKECVEQVKQRYGSDQEVLIIYDDLETNDMKSLVGYVQGQFPDAKAYFKDIPGVSVMATWTSFYDQCLPTNMLHLGISTAAVHFLEKRPCTLKNAFCYVTSDDEIEKSIFKEQARKDWEKFLLQRVKELIPGGRLFITVFGSTGDGVYVGKAFPDKPGIHDLLGNTLNIFAKRNQITAGELANITSEYYFRTKQECEEPFTDPYYPVSQSGLKLIHLEIIFVADPCRLEGQQIGVNDLEAAKSHAKKFMDFVRKFTYCTFYLGLDSGRSKEDKYHLTEAFYSACEDEVMKFPGDYGDDLVAFCLEIAKKGKCATVAQHSQ